MPGGRTAEIALCSILVLSKWDARLSEDNVKLVPLAMVSGYQSSKAITAACNDCFHIVFLPTVPCQLPFGLSETALNNHPPTLKTVDGGLSTKAR